MPALGKRRKREAGSAFAFRVSDVVRVPLRGLVLRLRLVEGEPSLTDLGVGSELVLTSPRGEVLGVRVVGHSTTSGVQTQKRLDRERELDVLIAPDPAAEAIEIGWVARGPVT